MRLDELLGVKALYDKDLDGIKDSIKAAGSKIMGEGSFAITIKSVTSPGVIKFWIDDSSYDTFIEYIQGHPSRFFPKLLSKPKKLTSFFTRPEQFPEKVSYVRMEELEPLEKSDFGIADFLSGNFIRRYLSPGDYDELNDDQLVEKFEEFETSERPEIKKFLDSIGGTKKDFLEFCKTVKGLIRSTVNGRNRLDIHEGNIMMRNGRLVITDPLFNKKDYNNAENLHASILAMQDVFNIYKVKKKTGPTRNTKSKDSSK